MSWIDNIQLLIVTTICAYTCKYYLHMMQLESYQVDDYQRWLAKNRDKAMGFLLTSGVIATGVAWVSDLLLGMLLGDTAGRIITLVVMIIGFGLSAYAYSLQLNAKQTKKPIVFTPRMKRLYAMTALSCLFVSAVLTAITIPPYLTFSALPYVVMVSAMIMTPFENRINANYLKDAQRILGEHTSLIKIGITGSYGKTSTKVILATILREKFNVYATPASFNTPMGLTRNIREELKPEHEVFIAEMGARHPGDIKELCGLVNPHYGMIVSVGEQHLETFGDINAVADTKYELIDHLKKEGVAFFGADDGIVDQLYQKTVCEKYRAGFGHGYLYMYAENLEVGVYGSRFLLCESAGERVACETGLLGVHNIQNIILAAAAARRLGLSMEQIAAGIKKVEPVPHRLQLIRGAGDMIIIDDAFNANPKGAAEALRVLSGFSGRRIVVTPGMVEQGAREEEINREFGRQMATRTDIAILVGKKHTKPIRDGLLNAGFDRENLYVVANLDEATKLLSDIGQPKDVILFENDLPDNYNE